MPMVKPLFCCSDYLVDDRGFVISKRGKPLKPSTNHKGYQIINIMKNGKRIGLGVHTAVARAFCDGYSVDLQVNHKDGNKKNNTASNLEWVTALENTRHAIDMLGFDNREENNWNAKAISGYDKHTNEKLYSFPSVATAGRYFSPNDENRARHIQQLICGIASGWSDKKSYKNCIWKYD